MKVAAYYVVGYSNGTPVLLGPHHTENEAYEMATNTSFDNGMFEVKKYFTLDRAEATRQWKYEQNKKTGNIALALKPVRHM